MNCNYNKGGHDDRLCHFNRQKGRLIARIREFNDSLITLNSVQNLRNILAWLKKLRFSTFFLSFGNY
jgi:hypothetical protein